MSKNTNSKTKEIDFTCMISPEWSSVAEYFLGSHVKYDNYVYENVVGGEDVTPPGTYVCENIPDCESHNIKWMRKYNCNETPNDIQNSASAIDAANAATLAAAEASTINHNNIIPEVECENVEGWSFANASGRPDITITNQSTCYCTGTIVTYNGNVYQANWGGIEIPGTTECNGEEECRNARSQWFKVGKCKLPDHRLDCSDFINWNVDVAFGTAAPFFYATNTKVIHNGVLYQANFPGIQTPGETLDPNCPSNQWTTIGECKPKIPDNSTNGNVVPIFDCTAREDYRTNFDYIRGNQVVQNGEIYESIFPGSEQPAVMCNSEQMCQNLGFQWMHIGTCS